MIRSAPEDHPQTFGHPRGLIYIAGTELWDRISFHGMQALLVLYMVEQLLLPGHVENIVGFEQLRAGIETLTGALSVQALASQIFGLYVGFVYFTPVLGGMVGDRILGRRRSVILGAVLLTAGHFCMAFDQSFLLAMVLLILGAGCLRGNLQPQVGELYAIDDRRRATGFQLYYSMINLGAFIAPIVSGFLGQSYGPHFGFGFAGFGMLIGLVIYLSAGKNLPTEMPRICEAARPSLTAEETRRCAALLCVVPVGSLFWMAQSQVWNTYNIWVRDHVDLTFGSWTMPVPWLQALDGLAPFIFLPPFLYFWRWQAARGREPDELGKMAIGCFIFAASTFWLGFGHLAADENRRVPLWWPVLFHLGSNIGWLYYTPSVSALFSRIAPKSINATMIGVSTLSVFLGSMTSGRLGGLYERYSPLEFWSLHAALVGAAGVIVLLGRPIFNRVTRDAND